MTGSMLAMATITSESMPPSLITEVPCRLTKLGSRKWTRYGRVPPSDTAWQPISPRGASMAAYAWPAGTRKPSVTILKWWISASMDSPMMCRMCSAELPWPSAPTLSCAGHAIFLSATMIGSPSMTARRPMACSTMRSDCHISSSRIRNRP